MSCWSSRRTRSCTAWRRSGLSSTPSFAPRIFLPYDKLLERGRVVQDRATRVGTHRVILESGDELEADYVVLASGSSYPFPAKSDVDSTAAALAKYAAASDRVEHAERVLLIGAGAVGIELAGEIKAAWPDKPVVLLDEFDDVLGETYRADLRAELRAQLESIGVELMLGAPLARVAGRAAHRAAAVHGSDGRRARAGGRPVVPVLRRPPRERLPRRRAREPRGADGFVRVEPTLQVARLRQRVRARRRVRCRRQDGRPRRPASSARREEHPQAHRRGTRPRGIRADAARDRRAHRSRSSEAASCPTTKGSRPASWWPRRRVATSWSTATPRSSA